MATADQAGRREMETGADPVAGVVVGDVVGCVVLLEERVWMPRVEVDKVVEG
jgi:hypothetical protein